MTAQREYVFNPTWDRETERLETNEAIWDAGTIEHLTRLGVGAGWSCLEIGAGNGSVAEWLAGRVGPDGHVLATDLETGRLDRLTAPQVEVRRHDLRTEEFPAAAFDLVHARMVVQHMPDRADVVARMVRAVRPGGWLMLEDTDSLPLFRSAVAEDFLEDVRVAGYGLMRKAGHEPRGGHFDLRMALAAGLEQVSASGRTVMVRGGSAQARHYMLWLEFMRPKIVAAGLLSDARIEQALGEMADPANYWLSQVMIATTGRAPS
jgi:SAM-dependent methyltransferase